MTGNDEPVVLQLFCQTKLFSLHFDTWYKVVAFAWLKPVTEAEHRQGMLWLNEFALTNRVRFVLVNYSHAIPAHAAGYTSPTLPHTVERLAFVWPGRAAHTPSTAALSPNGPQGIPERPIYTFGEEAQALAWLLQ